MNLPHHIMDNTPACNEGGISGRTNQISELKERFRGVLIIISKTPKHEE